MAIEKFTGGIVFGVSMATQTLSKNVSYARKLLGGFVSSVSKQIFSLKGLLVGLGSALVAGKFAGFVKEQFAAVDALGDTAASLNVTAAALAGLGYAADQSGSSQASIEKGLGKLVRASYEAASGLGTMSQTYKKLGLNAKEMNKLSPDQQFLKMADAISGLTNKQDQLAMTQKIFGKGAGDLVGVLREGSGGLQAMMADAEALGISLDAASVKGIQRAMDSFHKFKAAVGGIFRSIAVELAPYIEGITEKMTGFLIEGGRGKEAGKSIGGFIKDILLALADVGQKAFAGLLRFVAMGMDFLNQLRSTKLADKFGISSPTIDEFSAAGKLKNTAAWLEHERNLPSSRINKLAEGIKSETKAEAAGPKANPLGDMLSSAFSQAKGFGSNLLGTPGDILSGVMNSPIAQAQRQLAMANLSKDFGLNKGKTKYNDLKSFGAEQSGSLAAYQQRVRGAQQFDKVEVKQLDELKGIRSAIEKNPIVLASVGAK